MRTLPARYTTIKPINEGIIYEQINGSPLSLLPSVQFFTVTKEKKKRNSEDK